MKRILAVAVLMLLAVIETFGQTQTTTIQIVAPASLGTVTPTPVHYAQNQGGPISLASSTNGFNSSCTVTVGTTTLPVVYSAATLALTGTITPAMASVAPGTNLTVTINCTPAPLTMNTPAVLPNAQVGVAYSASLPTTTGIYGGTPPYTWTVNSGSLPPGLTLSSSGIVTGTPSGAGSSTFGFLVTDSSGLSLNFSPDTFSSFRPRRVTRGVRC